MELAANIGELRVHDLTQKTAINPLFDSAEKLRLSKLETNLQKCLSPFSGLDHFMGVLKRSSHRLFT